MLLLVHSHGRLGGFDGVVVFSGDEDMNMVLSNIALLKVWVSGNFMLT